MKDDIPVVEARISMTIEDAVVKIHRKCVEKFMTIQKMWHQL
jgi:hypothetical protein